MSSDSAVMNRGLGVVAIVLAATGMGVAGVFTRLTTAGVDPGAASQLGYFLVFGRMSVGLIGFLFLAVFTGRFRGLWRPALSPAVVAGGVCLGLSLSFYTTALLLTSLASAVVLVYTGPLFATILARFFRGERIAPPAAIGLVLVFVGMLFTVGILSVRDGGVSVQWDLFSGAGDGGQASTVMGGNFLGLASGALYGCALFFYGYRKDLDSITRGTWNFAWAALAAGIAHAVNPSWNIIANFTLMQCIYALGLFIISGFFALGLLIIAGKNLVSVELSTFSYWECVVAIGSGYLLYNEYLDTSAVIGTLFVIVGGLVPVIAATWRGRTRIHQR